MKNESAPMTEQQNANLVRGMIANLVRGMLEQAERVETADEAVATFKELRQELRYLSALVEGGAGAGR